jgi:hypothetical protein
MKEVLTVLATLLAIASFAPYIADTLRGRTKPHLYTYLIWTAVTVLVFAGQLEGGAGVGAWATGVVALLLLIVLLLCFKFGTSDVTRFDFALLILGLVAIIPWWFTKDPALSVMLATSINVFAFIPTLRKLWHDAASENLLSWVMNMLRHACGVGALATYTVATYFYPLVHLFMSALTVTIIITRSKSKE